MNDARDDHELELIKAQSRQLLERARWEPWKLVVASIAAGALLMAGATALLGALRQFGSMCAGLAQ